MILCNYCGGEVDDRLVCQQCGTQAGAVYSQAAPAGLGGAGYGAAAAEAGAPLTPYAPPSHPAAQPRPAKRKGFGGKLAALALSVAALGTVFWWANANRMRAAAELRQRELIEESGPLAVETISLRNIDGSGQFVGSASASFARRDIRFIAFQATLRNNAAGLQDVGGKLGVKYVAPNEQVVGSPDSSGYTFQLPLSISSAEATKVVSSSWGSDGGGSFRAGGRWRVELWFEGRKLGETSFTVN